MIEEWATQTQSGDRTELDIPDVSQSWRAVSATPETCLGPQCPLHDTCFATRARQVAETSQIVVVNHHLFFADLAIRSSGGEGILPRYEVVIFDEAHKLEDIATQFFGFEISNYRLEDLARDVRRVALRYALIGPILESLAQKLRDASAELFRCLMEQLPIREENETFRLKPATLEPLAGLAADLKHQLSALEAATSSAEEPLLAHLGRRSKNMVSELDFLFEAASPEHVFWAETRGRGVFVKASPIAIAQSLQATLYHAVDTLIFTSATLRAEGKFDFALERLGLEKTPCVAVDSPFDYQRQAALYLPRHLPDPGSPSFAEAVAREIVQLAQITGGRAFALFTSLRNMTLAHAYASKVLPCRVLLQGEKPKAALLEQFRSEPSVLFASQTFWEGVDVAGESLSLVIIDKLPFANPQDPLTAARIEQLRSRGEEPFQKYQLPAAAIALRQGFGRLIRTRQDRGIVAILDPRISGRRYGKSFLASLPPVWTTSEPGALKRWYAKD
jgi:ATP-dependent DNA helicase DinG